MTFLRRIVIFTLIVLGLVVFVPKARMFADSQASIAVNVSNTGPRKVEETTERAVARDYAAAWQAMTEALDTNRADLLAANFAGTANDKLVATITDQQKSGLHRRIVGKSHNVDAVFYSPEGSAMELHDTVQVQLQLMDGGKVLHSEDATLHYVVLLTAAENSWKVRVLEAVPSF